MNFLFFIQAVLAICLIIAILSQNRGAGLGSSWGGSGEFYGTRRGIDSALFKGTIFIAVVFVLISFAALII